MAAFEWSELEGALAAYVAKYGETPTDALVFEHRNLASFKV
jgi:hypothetical protein